MPLISHTIDVLNLLAMRRSFAGSMIGGIPETQEMLDFYAEWPR